MISWQYNGTAPLIEINKWCIKHLKETDWEYDGWETLYFINNESYMWFLLRWS